MATSTKKKTTTKKKQPKITVREELGNAAKRLENIVNILGGLPIPLGQGAELGRAFQDLQLIANRLYTISQEKDSTKKQGEGVE